jgi:hypothetical protein
MFTGHCHGCNVDAYIEMSKLSLHGRDDSYLAALLASVDSKLKINAEGIPDPCRPAAAAGAARRQRPVIITRLNRLIPTT